MKKLDIPIYCKIRENGVLSEYVEPEYIVQKLKEKQQAAESNQFKRGKPA